MRAVCFVLFHVGELISFQLTGRSLRCQQSWNQGDRSTYFPKLVNLLRKILELAAASCTNLGGQ